LRLSFGPFDQTPFLGPWRRPVIIAMCRADAYGGEARRQGALVPTRQVGRRQARAGRPHASCFAESGFRLSSRRINDGGRPFL
jgi:hypothetical protein